MNATSNHISNKEIAKRQIFFFFFYVSSKTTIELVLGNYSKKIPQLVPLKYTSLNIYIFYELESRCLISSTEFFKNIFILLSTQHVGWY